MKKNLNKVCSLILVFAVILTLIPAAVAAEHPFTDVPDGTYFSEPVAFCYANGLMNGTSPTLFQPELNMNRAMLVTVLYRMDGTQKTGVEVPFKDVPAGSYYKEAVAWAYTTKVVNGTSPTTFSPDVNIPREQMVTIFYRYAQSKGMDVSASANLSKYKDSSKVSSYAKAAFAWAVAEGIVNGTSATQLSPAGTANRAQCATIIQRFVKWTEENSKPEATEPSVPAADPSEPSTAPGELTPLPTDPSVPVTEPTKPHYHDFSYSHVIDYKPTCTSDGKQTFTCACGYSYSEWIPATGHTYGEPEVIAPTCLAEGYSVRTCHCGYQEKFNYVQKLSHNYQLTDSKKADCTNAGYETYKCVSGCEDSYTKELSALGHDWQHEHTDEIGHWGDQILVCRCGWSCSENIANEKGFDVGEYWSCYHQDYYGAIRESRNDHSYTFIGLPENWVVDTPAYDKWTCSRCEFSTENHDEVTGHKMMLTRDAFGSSCLRNNYDTYSCNSCSYSYDCDYIESHGHTWGEWIITEEVTSESRGWATRTCTEKNCGYTMGDYADRVLEILDNDGCYHSHKPETGSICIDCGVDTDTLSDWTPSPWIPRN